GGAAHAGRAGQLALDERVRAGEVGRLEAGRAQGDLDLEDAAVRPVGDVAAEAARAGVHVHEGRPLLAVAPVEEVLHGAADAVAAHLGDGAVRVVHHHPGGGARGREEGQHPVRADPQPAVAELDRFGGADVPAGGAAVQHDEVVEIG